MREGEGGEVVAVVLEGLVSCEVVGETEALLSLFWFCGYVKPLSGGKRGDAPSDDGATR